MLSGVWSRALDVATEPEELEPGDDFLFNDRRVPCVVEAAGEMDDDDGSIHVDYLVIARGPCDAELWLQRTSTGRIRVKESTPWGPYANVNTLRRLPDQ